ncbi:MAG TPA: LysM peptidoglycan-binding domain-containing protein [Gaiellaceae bacterium]|nr:LysM peptidoglycan-binding domain-containing protein [Gaiellaceae bacterium]
MGRRQLARLGAPVVFLVAVTIAVLLIRAGLDHGGAGRTSTLGSAISVSTPTGAGGQTRPSTASKGATGSAERRYYTVQKGDTFGSIAARFGTTSAKLEALNPKANPTTLQVGQRIRVK